MSQCILGASITLLLLVTVRDPCTQILRMEHQTGMALNRPPCIHIQQARHTQMPQCLAPTRIPSLLAQVKEASSVTPHHNTACLALLCQAFTIQPIAALEALSQKRPLVRLRSFLTNTNIFIVFWCNLFESSFFYI